MIECNENEKIVINGVTYYKPIEKEKPMTGWESPTIGESYLRLQTDAKGGYRSYTYFEKIPSDQNADLNACAFRPENEQFVKDLARHEILWRNIAKWQALNDIPCTTGRRYFISGMDGELGYNFETESNTRFYYPNAIYFSSKEKVEECIEVFKHELTWDMNEFRFRSDLPKRGVY